MTNVLNKMRAVVLVIGLSIFASGCSDFLEADPDSALNQELLYNDYKDIFPIKFGMYDILQQLVDQMFVIGECPADLVVSGPGAIGKYRDVAEFIDNNVYPSNQYLDKSGFYQLINHCNDALVRLPKLYDNNPVWVNSTINSGMKGEHIYNMVVAEILWGRAFAYVQLIKNWGDVPFFTEPMYTAEDVKKSMDAAPTDRNVILDQLEKDMLWAVNNAWVNWNWTNYISGAWNHQTVNGCSAIGLLAEVYLMRHKYEDAYSANCLLRITKPGYRSPILNENFNDSWSIGGASMNSGRTWQYGLFRMGNEQNQGNLWQEQGLVLAFDIESVSEGGQYKEFHSITKWSNNRVEDGGEYVIKPSHLSYMKWMENMDRWRGVNASVTVDTFAGRFDSIVWKHLGLNNNNGSRNRNQRRGLDRTTGIGNVHVLRTADLWLKAAECANRLGLTSDALDIVNQIRGRVGVMRIPLGADATIEELEDAIMEERAMELAFESYRWHDLVRVSRTRNDASFLIDRVVEKELDPVKKEQLRARLELRATAPNPYDWFLLPEASRTSYYTPAAN